jgi:hypothetical protein
MRKCLKFFKPLKLGIKGKYRCWTVIVQKIIEEMEDYHIESKKIKAQVYFTIPKIKKWTEKECQEELTVSKKNMKILFTLFHDIKTPMRAIEHTWIEDDLGLMLTGYFR